MRLIKEHRDTPFDREKLLNAWSDNADKWLKLINDKTPAIVLLGARAGDGLIASLETALPYRVADLTCGGLRSITAPPENSADLSDEELIKAYAKALLSQVPCMRMEDVSARKKMLLQNVKGIVYHTVRFCDYYSFEYEDVVKTAGVPVLKLESDYTAQSSGQLSTRIGAFLENFEDGLDEKRATKSETDGDNKVNENGKYYIGIDSGSTTTNVVATDSD